MTGEAERGPFLWGSYDLDDPFPLFAEARDLGAVHRVTLADGHDAWLVVRYDEAMAALSDLRLSKDMHAALSSGSEVVAEGLPGPSFARHMLSVDPPDHTRLRGFVSGAFSPKRVEGLRPGVQAITRTLLDEVAARALTAWSTSSPLSPSPCPSTLSVSCWGCPRRTGSPWARG